MTEPILSLNTVLLLEMCRGHKNRFPMHYNLEFGKGIAVETYSGLDRNSMVLDELCISRREEGSKSFAKEIYLPGPLLAAVKPFSGHPICLIPARSVLGVMRWCAMCVISISKRSDTFSQFGTL